MRDALAHFVVDGYERAVGSERLLHRAGKSLRAREERSDELDWQVRERFDVNARNEEDVPGEDGSRIEEPEGRCVFEHTMSRSRGGYDLAEDAGHSSRGSFSSP
jgi:hypothetical protein